MPTQIPTTNIEPGKWYPATQPPPVDLKHRDEVDFCMVLGIQNLGIVAGFYDLAEGRYYMYCERYDSFNDLRVDGADRDEAINDSLDWVYELASGVMCWMIVPTPMEVAPVDNGENDDEYAGETPGESDSMALRIWELGRMMPLHPN